MADRSPAERLWLAAVGTLNTCVLCGRWGIQVAHRNEGKGMGIKTRHWNTAALCVSCHDEIDNGRDLPREERRARMDRAITLTHDRLAERGVIVVDPKQLTGGWLG